MNCLVVSFVGCLITFSFEPLSMLMLKSVRADGNLLRSVQGAGFEASMMTV